MANKDKDGNWYISETDIKRRERQKAEVEKNRMLNMADEEITKHVNPDGSVELRKNGRFVKGTRPRSTFKERPQDISAGGWNKNMVASYQYQRFWNMERSEFVKIGKCWGIVSLDKGDDPKDYEYYPHTMIEELAYRRVLESAKSLSDMREVTNRVEGTPVEHVEAKVENRFANMSDDELKAIARAEFGEIEQ